MEIEREYLGEQVAKAYEKIMPWKDGGPFPFWMYIREEYDKVRGHYEKLEKEYDDYCTTLSYAMRNLKTIEEKLRRNRDNMMFEMPLWCVPLHPVISKEDQDDFPRFAEYLYRYYQHLNSMVEKYPRNLKDYESRMDAIKKSLKSNMDSHRNDYTAGEFWKTSMELRDKLHLFPSLVDAAIKRYTEEECGGSPSHIQLQVDAQSGNISPVSKKLKL